MQFFDLLNDLVSEAQDGCKKIKIDAVEFKGILFKDLRNLGFDLLTAINDVAKMVTPSKVMKDSDSFPMVCKDPALPLIVETESHRFHEVNDCSVKALTVVTGKAYATCHKALEDVGRKPRHGCNGIKIIAALENLGFEATFQPYTGKTFITLDVGTNQPVLVFSKAHVVAVTDNVIRDWSNGTRRKPVYALLVSKGA